MIEHETDSDGIRIITVDNLAASKTIKAAMEAMAFNTRFDTRNLLLAKKLRLALSIRREQDDKDKYVGAGFDKFMEGF